MMNYDANDRLATDNYDNNGNTVVNASVSNVYDFENHLIQHGSVAIVYDGDGNRVSKTAGGVTTNYLVDTNSITGYAQVVEELQGGMVVRVYSYGLERISQTQMINNTATVSYYGYDGHGSVRQLFSSTGTVTDTYDYDAFGNLITSTGSTPNNYLFAGEQYDSDLGLYYNRARYLDVRQGRFWGMDTWEGHANEPHSLHKYLYVSANPINWKDRSGHEEADVNTQNFISGTINSLNSAISNISLRSIAAVRTVFTVAAAFTSRIFTNPNLIEELEEGGEEGVAKVQQSFEEFEGVVSEAEAEATSVWSRYSQLREALNQVFTKSRFNPANIQYHHIVEQVQEEISGFSSRAINSLSNVIPTPEEVHTAITNFYQSSQNWLEEGQTLRDYMATQPWEYQWRAGLEIWKQAMASGGQNITWRP